MNSFYQLINYALLFTFVLQLSSCKKDNPVLLPIIDGFTPTTAFPGAGGVPAATVVINGSHFSTIINDNEVKFNGLMATVSAATATQLTTLIPTGATTGKITVTVNGHTATSATDFIVLSPVITGFSPASGIPGATITISGTNLSGGASTTSSNYIFKVNGMEASLVQTGGSDTQLQILVPNGSSTGKITVEQSGGSSLYTSANDFEVLLDIPRNGLVAFYPFTGNANDVGGNNLHGTLGAGAATAAPVPAIDRFGKPSHAYLFDGVNDVITMGNPPLLQISNQITISGWFNFAAYPAGSNEFGMICKIFFDPAAGGNPRRCFYIYQGVGLGIASYNFDGSALSYSAIVSASSPLNTWVFISVVMDGTSVKFYRDSVLINNATANGTALADGTLGNLDIGRYGGGLCFNGIIDDIIIYNRGLSATEITQLFQQTVTKY